jgi:WD40 repeat protein
MARRRASTYLSGVRRSWAAYAGCTLTLLAIVALIVSGTPSGAAAAEGPDAITPESAASVHQIRRLGNGLAQSLVFSPDGTMLAVASAERIALYDAETRVERRVISTSMLENSLTFSPDGQTLFAGASDGTARVWRVEDGTLLHTVPGERGPVESVAFSPDGQALATVSADRIVRLWRVADGAALASLEVRSARSIA